MTHSGNVLIYAINRTDRWWRFIGKSLGFEGSVVVSDIRGAGDVSTVEEFYAELRRRCRGSGRPGLFSEVEVREIVARCRVLRWLAPERADAMVQSMAVAFERVLDRVQPKAVLSFPIDRYVSDVLERLARRRGIPYFELTASLVPTMAMLMYRGQLVMDDGEVDARLIQKTVAEIATPNFTPSYVAGQSAYTAARFLRTFSYFRVRGWGFKVISLLKRDPDSLHYLDAQAFLGHKPHLRDLRIIKLMDPQWRERLSDSPRDTRIFFGLPLFPEASIDYWVDDLALVDYENMLVDAATAYSRAGWQVLVKDHPLQFGFRQCELIERLRALPNVVLVPYDVSGNEILAHCGANFTLTGTLGLQAALGGVTSVAYRSYYATPEDFVMFSKRSEIPGLPGRTKAYVLQNDLERLRIRLIGRLLRGSFDGDFFSFKAFDESEANDGARQLAKNFGRRVARLIDQGNWPPRLQHSDSR